MSGRTAARNPRATPSRAGLFTQAKVYPDFEVCSSIHASPVSVEEKQQLAERDNPRLQLSRPSDAQHDVRPRLRLVHILQTWHPAPQVHDAAAHKDVDRQTRGCRVFAQLAIAGGRLSAIARMRSSSMMPGPLGIAEASPTALAPYAIARRASSTLLMQQTLIRTPPRITAKCKWLAGVWCDRLIATEL